MKCKNCGAEVAPGAQRCEYCDSAVACEENVAAAATVASAAVAAGPSTQQRAVRRADIFAEIKQSASYAQRGSTASHGRLPGGSGMVMLAPIIFFVFFIGVSLFIASMALGMAGSHFGAVGAIPAFMSIVPIGFVALAETPTRSASEERIIAGETSRLPCLRFGLVITGTNCPSCWGYFESGFSLPDSSYKFGITSRL